MKKKYTFLFLIISFSLLFSFNSSAQNEAASGEVFFNYGSTTGGVSQYYYSSFTIGQPVVGPYFGADYQGALGFWSRFLVAPAPPIITASEGDYPDRILLEWDVDPLSPASDLGFKIFRDGAFLASLDPSTLEFIDFNVIPGNFYNYEVRGVNIFGDGYPAQAVGFVNPNGSVTGQITSINGNPVADVQVTLEPTIGKSLSFEGTENNRVEIPYHTGYSSNELTVSTWVKIGENNDFSGILDAGRLPTKNWFILTNNTTIDNKGIVFGIGESGTSFVEEQIEFDADPDGWHHLAFTYNGADLNMYIDGKLKGTKAAVMEAADLPLEIGGRNFDGNIDDVRIYSRQLSQTEIIRTMNATVPSTAEGLVAYWKFDEGTGYKVFDLAENQLDGYITGASFSNDRPNVLNAGVTDESGYYLIDGINYGGGQNFTARPSKDFEFNNALEFNASNSQYAIIDSLVLEDSLGMTVNLLPRDTGTIELWFKPSSLTGSQTILANGSVFDLSLNGNSLDLTWGGGAVETIGTITETEYTHVAISYFSGGTPSLKTYINGANEQIFSANSFTNWGDQWSIGRNSSGTNYFNGLVDEIAFFNTVRTLPQIQLTSSTVGDSSGVRITDLELLAFFSLNESVGTTFSDQSSNNFGQGYIHGAAWTSVTARPETVPHEFNPVSRIVTLNPSSTGVDNVNFTDISTVSVSGYVRYAGTQCFAENVEILVDGHPHVPPIFTNDEGFFVADFEPGASFSIEPNLEGHTFIPAFWDINNIVVPKAGIVFNDQTTRNVEGLFAGGLCTNSIVGAEDSVIISLTSTNECFKQYFKVLPNSDDYEFKDVPPLHYTVGLEHHPISAVKTFFSQKGGAQIDLTEQDTTIDFIYRSPIEIETTDLPSIVGECNLIEDPVLEQFENYQLNIKVFETYSGQKCYLDSATLVIDNAISGGGADVDTSFNDGIYKHKFLAGSPEIAFPHLKYITITARDIIDDTVEGDSIDSNRIATKNLSAIITGKRKRPTQFTTTSPEIPWLILRDPPGDGSYSYWESGDQNCFHMSSTATTDETLDTKTTLSLGAEFSTGGLFWSYPTEISADASFGYSMNSTQTSEYETQVCMTATSTISTDDGDLIVGGEMGGDLYIGGALNVIFGVADILTIDSMCQIVTDTTLIMDQNGIATQYMYSEYFIENHVIPDLMTVNTDSSLASIEMWEQIIQRNQDTKEDGVFHENYSFNGGVNYEYTKETESTKSTSISWEATVSNEFAASAGIKVGGVGASNETSFEVSTSWGGSQGASNTITNKVGYHLTDDEIGDNFSVDVLEDRVYGVPVFNILSGQSSCPHEEGTQHRDEVSFNVQESVQANVAETEPAVFYFNLGNVTPSEETRNYVLNFEETSNPHGATIRANGQILNNIEYEIPFGESVPLTLTIEKGPVEYDYEDIEIIFSSLCERDRADALVIDADSIFDQRIKISAYFIESCSDVNISSPAPGWVVTPDSNDEVYVTLDSYNKDDSDLELIRLQYRPADGNGIWINIAEVPKDSLGVEYEVVRWDVEELSDGPFELRAITQCQGELPPGISDFVVGKIERDPPELLGTPSPSDGILHASDQIFIEFTEDIDCSNLTSLPGALEDFVGLINTQSSQPIDIEISCTENRIYLVPVIQNTYIENKQLRAEVRGIKDLVGNAIPEPITWEFYVDRNPLKWVGGDIVDIKYEEETWLVTRTIQNTGGQNESFTLDNIPEWLTPSATSGEIAPGGTATIVFTVPDQITNGQYNETILLHNNMGDEPLIIDLAVLCRPPEWSVTPSAYDYNMTFTVELNIEGETSQDDFDQVGAFVGEDLRGMANVEYVPSIDKYLAFLTVYSNQIEGETLDFRIWDASDCLLYGTVLESYTFVNDGLYGTPGIPEVLHTQNIVLKKIPVHNGWNWISFNLDMPDKDINVVLESLEHPEDILIKDQVSFSQYFNSANIWAGSLQDLGYTSMYQYKGTQNDTITLLGYPIDSDTVDIPINEGWNWIGYLPQNGATVDSTLQSLTPILLNGDIVKSQTAFAQYVAGVGWIGSLDYMEAPNGYLLKTSGNGTLQMPESKNLIGSRPDRPMLAATTRSSTWEVNPGAFEHSMTLVGMVEANGEAMLKDDDEVGVFVDGEVRGATKSLYIEALDIHLLFLTIYSNNNGEQLDFKYLDSETGFIHDITENMPFEINGNMGTVDEPQILTFEITTAVNNLSDDIDLQIIPNPFRGSTNLSLALPQDDLVTIRVSDVLGNKVRELKINTPSGRSWIELDANNDSGEPLTTGVYFISIEGNFGQATKKVFINK